LPLPLCLPSTPHLPAVATVDEDDEFDAVAAAALPGVPGSAVEKCDAYRQYSSAKLSQLSFSAELERRFESLLYCMYTD
jgi:hypothetical protein